MISQKQIALRNYEVFFPILENLAYEHRYWDALRKEYFPHETIVDERVANLILTQITNIINNTNEMTDEEFDDSECVKTPCLKFHDQAHPVITEYSLDQEYRLKNTILDDLKKKFKVELIHESELENPLIIEQHILYGGIKKETRYKDDARSGIETVFEETE